MKIIDLLACIEELENFFNAEITVKTSCGAVIVDITKEYGSEDSGIVSTGRASIPVSQIKRECERHNLDPDEVTHKLIFQSACEILLNLDHNHAEDPELSQ